MLDYFEFSLYLFYVFVLLGILMLANVVYFQIRYQKKTDYLFNDDNYIDGGWIYNSMRMMMYAHYCLFHRRARRAGVLERVRRIPSVIKFHLYFHWFSVIVVSLILTIVSILDYYLLG